MPVALRSVESSDVVAMAAIRAQESQTDASQTEAFWTNRIGLYLSGEHSPQQALRARAAFVAVEGHRVVGFVAGHRTRRFGCDGELQWINVVADRRGLGIADQLMTKIGAWFVEQNAHRVCVNVSPDNAAARKLYTRCGAQLLNEHWMVWEDSQAMCAAKAGSRGRR